MRDELYGNFFENVSWLIIYSVVHMQAFVYAIEDSRPLHIWKLLYLLYLINNLTIIGSSNGFSLM